MNLFRRDDGYLFALTYGRGDWVENVLAAGGCTIETRGHLVELTDPELREDPERRGIPLPVKWVLELIDVEEFLFLRVD